VGLPKFPTLPQPPSKEKILEFLLETVALEELALAALVNAEAEKVQEIGKANLAGPLTPGEAVRVNESVARVLEAAGDKGGAVAGETADYPGSQETSSPAALPYGGGVTCPGGDPKGRAWCCGVMRRQGQRRATITGDGRRAA